MKNKSKWRFLVLENGKTTTKFLINEKGEIHAPSKTIITKKGKRKIAGYMVKQHNTPSGYKRVNLEIDGKKNNNLLVHRLVALAWLPHPVDPIDKTKPAHPATMVVNHKDKNRKNNNARNLEWLTQHENMLHCFGYEYADNLKAYRKHKNAIYKMYCQNLAIVTISKKLQLTKTIVKKLLAEQLNEFDFDVKLFGGQ